MIDQVQGQHMQKSTWTYPREKILLLRWELLVHTFPTRDKLQSYDAKAKGVSLGCELPIACILWCYVTPVPHKTQENISGTFVWEDKFTGTLSVSFTGMSLQEPSSGNLGMFQKRSCKTYTKRKLNMRDSTHLFPSMRVRTFRSLF